MSTAVAATGAVEAQPFGRDKITDGKLAMWLFLASEAMFFAGLFGTFVVLRWMYPAEFHPESLFDKYGARLNIPLATINTLVLITSSLTMVLAVDAVKRKKDKQIAFFLAVTALLGLVFCGIKGVEYYSKLHHVDPATGAVHSITWQTSIFYSCYFVMTGIHALHVVGGILPLAWMAALAGSGRYSREGNNTVEMWGLYWHFVDLVWIYLFPTLYLLR